MCRANTKRPGQCVSTDQAIADKGVYPMSTTIILPPLELLDQAAAHLVNLASDASHERALNKALWHLQSAIEIRQTSGAFLMPSGTRAGVIHRISHTFGCDCQAAARGVVCWHSAAIAIIEEAAKYTRPTMPALPMGDKLARARMALAAIDELY